MKCMIIGGFWAILPRTTIGVRARTPATSLGSSTSTMATSTSTSTRTPGFAFVPSELFSYLTVLAI